MPVVRTRAAGISQLANLADKVRAWAQVTEAGGPCSRASGAGKPGTGSHRRACAAWAGSPLMAGVHRHRCRPCRPQGRS